jgi:hypothetical protein
MFVNFCADLMTHLTEQILGGYFNWGFKYGYIFQNLDWSKYTFSDQYDPILGIVRPSVNSNIVSDFSSAANWSSGLNVTGWNWK